MAGQTAVGAPGVTAGHRHQATLGEQLGRLTANRANATHACFNRAGKFAVYRFTLTGQRQLRLKCFTEFAARCLLHRCKESAHRLAPGARYAPHGRRQQYRDNRAHRVPQQRKRRQPNCSATCSTSWGIIPDGIICRRAAGDRNDRARRSPGQRCASRQQRASRAKLAALSSQPCKAITGWPSSGPYRWAANSICGRRRRTSSKFRLMRFAHLWAGRTSAGRVFQ